MPQTSHHKVTVQIEFYTETVKCLSKYKAIGNAVNMKLVCLVQHNPAKKSSTVLSGNQGIQEHIQKKKTALRGTQPPPKIDPSFPQVFRPVLE